MLRGLPRRGRQSGRGIAMASRVVVAWPLMAFTYPPTHVVTWTAAAGLQQSVVMHAAPTYLPTDVDSHRWPSTEVLSRMPHRLAPTRKAVAAADTRRRFSRHRRIGKRHLISDLISNELTSLVGAI